MSQALENLELASLHFAPELLTLGGILIVLAGLAAWLGGLRLTPWIAAATAALAGLTAALIFITPSPIGICVMTVIPAAISCFLQKPTIILAGAALALTTAALIGLAPTLDNTLSEPPKHPLPRENGNRAALSIPDTASEIKSEAVYWAQSVKKAAKQAPAGGFAVGGVAGLFLIAAGFFLPRLITAATCATIGVTMIYVGMTLVLLYKGARPLTHIYSRASFYGTVALAMIAFGTFVQFILCPAKAKNADREQKRGEK